MYFALFILLFLVLFWTIFFHCRKKKLVCRIRCMDKCQKCSLLDELALPLGYTYQCRSGFFSSTIDAWQKTAGYTWLYDYMAPRFQMVFDALPVYFDYQGKTWLIEFWKGQYGINTGAEIGIYHTDRLLSEDEYKTALFHAVGEDEMLPCFLTLCNKGAKCVYHSGKHWWLTAFLPGRFSNPADLSLNVSVNFPDDEMLDAFHKGLCRAGYNRNDISVRALCLSFSFHRSDSGTLGLLSRIRRFRTQCLNYVCCKLYLWITRPFVNTEDRILYLYYYLPAAFRRMLRLHRFHRRLHKKNGATPPSGQRQKRIAL